MDNKVNLFGKRRRLSKCHISNDEKKLKIEARRNEMMDMNRLPDGTQSICNIIDDYIFQLKIDGILSQPELDETQNLWLKRFLQGLNCIKKQNKIEIELLFDPTPIQIYMKTLQF